MCVVVVCVFEERGALPVPLLGRASEQAAGSAIPTDRRCLVKAGVLQRLFPINSEGSGLPAVHVEYLRALSVARGFSRVIPIGRAADASGSDRVAGKSRRPLNLERGTLAGDGDRERADGVGMGGVGWGEEWSEWWWLW